MISDIDTVEEIFDDITLLRVVPSQGWNLMRVLVRNDCCLNNYVDAENVRTVFTNIRNILTKVVVSQLPYG